jgi:hypothetical protein
MGASAGRRHQPSAPGLAGDPGAKTAASRLDGLGHPLGDDDLADIVELVLAGHQRILLMQRALLEVDRPAGKPGAASALAAVWERLADMIDVQAAAEEEICYLPLLAAGSWSQEELADAVGDLDQIREAMAEARLQPAGSWPWWRAVRAALSACIEHFERQEEGVLADFGGRADRSRRQELGSQWSAFTAARVSDLSSGGQAGDAACQLCQWPLPASHPHVLDTEGCAVFCACHCCYQLYLWTGRDESSRA